ncbi:MAG: glycosyltransferase [Deltaproteobacteria bacterium]|nr:glycosyltransferase [Deltaproteobacteria bacterium]
MRVLVATFAEVPSLGFESEAATEAAKALEAWCEVELFTPMVDATAHLEAFYGGRLHRVTFPQGEGVESAAAAFRRGLERQVESAAWDAVHVFSPVEGRLLADRLPPDVPLVYQPQPIPSLLARLGNPGKEWLAKLAADEAVLVGRASAILLHEASDASALRYRRRLPPHVVLAEPVDLDLYHWEQLVPGTAPVVLVLDPGLDEVSLGALDEALRAIPGAVVWRLELATAALHVEPPPSPAVALGPWFSGAADHAVPLRLAARAALNAADVVVAAQPGALEGAGVATSCRRWGILQAAACRRPLVVADSTGFPIPAGLAEHVFPFPAKDWAAMAGLVRSVLFHPAKAIQIAERARRQIELRHSAADFRRRLRAIYAGLLGDEPGLPRPAPVRLEGPP